MNESKFQHENFTCDVEVFRRGVDLVVRLYHKDQEQKDEELKDLVVVNPGFGFVCLKFKGDDGLLSGFLDHHFFSGAAVLQLIDFVLALSPRSANSYIPYHIRLVGATSIIEYNGEF